MVCARFVPAPSISGSGVGTSEGGLALDASLVSPSWLCLRSAAHSPFGSAACEHQPASALARLHARVSRVTSTVRRLFGLTSFGCMQLLSAPSAKQRNLRVDCRVGKSEPSVHVKPCSPAAARSRPPLLVTVFHRCPPTSVVVVTRCSPSFGAIRRRALASVVFRPSAVFRRRSLAPSAAAVRNP